MNGSHMAVVVPLNGLSPNSQEARKEIWGTVTNLLMPMLGKGCGKFYPAGLAWGHTVRKPFGIIMGKEDPAEFLCLYRKARKAQSEATAFHMAALLDKIDPNAVRRAGDALVCPVELDMNDTDLIGHAFWHVAMHEGSVLPDCGVYYTGLGRAIASREEEKTILISLSDYALCMVTLEALEVNNG